MFRLFPDYSTVFVRDRALWMYVVLLIFYGFGSLLNIMFAERQMEITMAYQMERQPASASMDAMQDTMMAFALISAIVTGVIYALFFFAWAWVSTLKHVAAWWITLVLQSLSLAGLVFSAIMFLFFYSILAGNFGGQDLFVPGAMMWGVDVPTFVKITLVLSGVNIGTSLLLTFWWWRRRRMYGVTF